MYITVKSYITIKMCVWLEKYKNNLFTAQDILLVIMITRLFFFDNWKGLSKKTN